MKEVTIIGKASILIRGNASVQVDNYDSTEVSGQSKFEVSQQAQVSVNGQLIATFEGQGAFVADGVRVVANGRAVVNMVSDSEVFVGGPGLLFAEGCSVRADQMQTLLAIGCPSGSVHGNASLVAVDCDEISAHDQATLTAARCIYVRALAQSTVAASDCAIVHVEEGLGSFKPRVSTTRCSEVISVRQSFGPDGDGCVEEIHVPVETAHAL